MGIGAVLIVGFILAALIVMLFARMMNPRDVDEEEAAAVVKQKRRWWKRKP